MIAYTLPSNPLSISAPPYNSTWLTSNYGKWWMSFNPDKCEVLRIKKLRKNIYPAEYSINGIILNTVDHAKYLGVTIQSKLLSWKPHIM